MHGGGFWAVPHAVALTCTGWPPSRTSNVSAVSPVTVVGVVNAAALDDACCAPNCCVVTVTVFVTGPAGAVSPRSQV